MSRYFQKLAPSLRWLGLSVLTGGGLLAACSGQDSERDSYFNDGSQATGVTSSVGSTNPADGTMAQQTDGAATSNTTAADTATGGTSSSTASSTSSTTTTSGAATGGSAATVASGGSGDTGTTASLQAGGSGTATVADGAVNVGMGGAGGAVGTSTLGGAGGTGDTVMLTTGGAGGTGSGGMNAAGGAVSTASAGAPAMVDDGRGPHAPATGEIVVLYDGNGFDLWEPLEDGLNEVNWTENRAEGWMQVLPTKTNHIVTNQQHLHEDVFVHLEFWSPDEGPGETGQGRGNSGVYLQSRFELQILDSYGRQPETDGCGSIYGVKAPLVNACKPPEQWNTYEIDFTAPRYDGGGTKISNARITAWLNDQLVQDDQEVSGTTSAGIPGEPNGPQPLYLQDHTDTVRFRNIWWIHK